MKLLVVGAGAMGQWFADSVGDRFEDVAFADTDEEAAVAAAEGADGRTIAPASTDDAAADDASSDDGANGDAPTDEGASDERFDLVCIAVPLPAATDVIAEYADRVDGAICDVTGSMEGPVAAMDEHCPDAERLSLHPLFAPENEPGTVAVVENGSGTIVSRVRDALLSAGNRLVETTPAEHDEAMETVQAKTHAAVLAFALAADDVPAKFQTPVSAGLFDLVSQVTDGDARVYADIQAAFDGAEDVADAAREIAEADDERFADLYERVR